MKPPTEKELARDPKAAERFRRDQRGIFVKRFDEVPVADVEIVFPDKEVGLKLIDQLTLYGTALAAIIGGLTAFLGASVELSVIMSTMTVMGGKLFQVWCTDCCELALHTAVEAVVFPGLASASHVLRVLLGKRGMQSTCCHWPRAN